MAYPSLPKLNLPVDPYEVGGYHFRDRVRRKILLWATHLGDDVQAVVGTEVKAIGDGEVVWSEIRPGSEKKKNWGGLVVVGHNNDQLDGAGFQTFYSVYGHLMNLRVNTGDFVIGGQTLGVVAERLTPENGWWEIAHLHFGIYCGPWRDVVLPGYKRIEEFRTKTKWWQDPCSFIEQYNSN